MDIGGIPTPFCIYRAFSVILELIIGVGGRELGWIYLWGCNGGRILEVVLLFWDVCVYVRVRVRVRVRVSSLSLGWEMGKSEEFKLCSRNKITSNATRLGSEYIEPTK